MSETKTTVVHVNCEEWANTPEDQRVYIGRAVPRRGFKASKWANPYHIGKDGTRFEVCMKYESYLSQHPELVYELEELRGKVLGCWCAPEMCHGNVLISLLARIDRGLVRLTDEAEYNQTEASIEFELRVRNKKREIENSLRKFEKHILGGGDQ